MPIAGNSARIARAASRPSVAKDGGIRMSRTTSSGVCSRTRRISSTASPARPVTSNAECSSSRAIPSRRRRSSSAITTRVPIGLVGQYRRALTPARDQSRRLPTRRGSRRSQRGSQGTMSTLCSIVDRTYEVFNSRSFEEYRELLAEDVELVMSGIHVKGLAAVTDFVSVTAQVRPAMRIEPQRVFVEAGDTIVTQVRMIDAPPEGSPDDALVETDACGLYRIEDGRIVIWRVDVDPGGEDLSSVALAAAAAEQSAPRRVPELVARQVAPEQLFEVVGEELGRLLGGNPTRVVRFEPIPTAVDVPGEEHAWVEVPILVDGRPWGAIEVGGPTVGEEPGGTEERVAQFAELLSTSISNFESRSRVTRLADEQSALRRIATLVAGDPPPEVVFGTLAEELGELLEVDIASILRSETDATATVPRGWH